MLIKRISGTKGIIINGIQWNEIIIPLIRDSPSPDIKNNYKQFFLKKLATFINFIDNFFFKKLIYASIFLGCRVLVMFLFGPTLIPKLF